jgi:hypothetical protein
LSLAEHAGIAERVDFSENSVSLSEAGEMKGIRKGILEKWNRGTMEQCNNEIFDTGDGEECGKGTGAIRRDRGGR